MRVCLSWHNATKADNLHLINAQIEEWIRYLEERSTFSVQPAISHQSGPK